MEARVDEKIEIAENYGYKFLIVRFILIFFVLTEENGQKKKQLCFDTNVFDTLSMIKNLEKYPPNIRRSIVVQSIIEQEWEQFSQIKKKISHIFFGTFHYDLFYSV